MTHRKQAMHTARTQGGHKPALRVDCGCIEAIIRKRRPDGGQQP
jgi:hypothetical protein